MLFFNFINPYIVYITYNLITILTIYLIFTKKTWILAHQKTIWLIVTILLVYSQIARYFLTFLVGRFTIEEGLPFFVCRISSLFLTFYMFKPKDRFKPLLYFWGATGILGVFVPNGSISNIALLTETFFIDHYLLAVTPFYLLHINQYKPKLNDALITTMVFALVLFIFVPLNTLLNADYFYLKDQSVLQYILPGLSQPMFIIIHTIGMFLFFMIYYSIASYYHHTIMKKRLT
ncbi:MAG: hypothetical protein ACLFRI_00200 [Candidatus Izemoplasmataceae bacterium]